MKDNGSAKRVIRKDDLSFFQKMYITEIAKGLRLTVSKIFKPKFTHNYPDEPWPFQPSFRGRPVLVEEDGIERCVACGLCSRVCPSLAIEVQASETELEKERYPIRFEINMIRCIFCGFCEEVCPEEAIVMSDEYLVAYYQPRDAIYGKDKLLMSTERLAKRLEFLRQNR